MKLILKDFQDEAVNQLVKRIRGAGRDAASGELQSVCLSSPTGSGKTVMMTGAIEKIIQGDDDNAPMPNATFLWVTDQPELNEQTRRKMQEAGTVLTSDRLVVIDASFDRETLRPGAVHFLNIQKLGKEKYLVTHGDDREYTIWETMKNTIDARPGQFFVLVDEAHRGMGESTRARNEATTIIQKFIKGSTGEIPPVPTVVGISATPERFNKLIEGTGRTARSVNIEPEDVRSSGLLKETIRLFHPKKDQPTDMTMLRAAARSLKTFTDRWGAYCKAQGEPAVQPLLVVQVQDAAGKQDVSRTDLEEAIRVITDELGPMPSAAFAHSFQGGGKIEAGREVIRYLAPPDIQGDPDVRVVFFKASLNTGWDCPRAEVMMSFRTAVDATLIAQLVGRMVRTPLARSIADDEVLNTVSLYLPHYDEKGLNAVLDRLSKPDGDTMPPVDIEEGEEAITLQKADGSEAYFAALGKLPSYVIPRKRKTSQVRRLMRLSRLLAHDDINEDAPDTATDALLATLDQEYKRLKGTKVFKTVVEERGKIDVRAVNWTVGTDVVAEGDTLRIDIAAENIDDLFDAAGKKLGEGVHKAWWRKRAGSDASLREKAKLELFCLTLDPDVLRTVEKTAQDLVQAWFKKYGQAIEGLPEARRQEYDEVRMLAAEPELSPLSHPASIEGKMSDKQWPKHLYTDGKAYPAFFNKPETQVLEMELARKDVKAWLRNIDRKHWALRVPYESNGEWESMYPDFLILRSTPEGLTVDLIDPHSIGLADAPAKAAGLARFAAKHANRFGRIELILLDGKTMKRLDLADENVRNKVKGVKLPDQLRKLFDEA